MAADYGQRAYGVEVYSSGEVDFSGAVVSFVVTLTGVLSVIKQFVSVPVAVTVSLSGATSNIKGVAGAISFAPTLVGALIIERFFSGAVSINAAVSGAVVIEANISSSMVVDVSVNNAIDSPWIDTENEGGWTLADIPDGVWVNNTDPEGAWVNG